MHDTTPEAAERYYELLAARTPAERLAIAAQLTRTVRSLAEASIRSANPGATDDEVRRCLAERLYGVDVADRLFGKGRHVGRAND